MHCIRGTGIWYWYYKHIRRPRRFSQNHFLCFYRALFLSLCLALDLAVSIPAFFIIPFLWILLALPYTKVIFYMWVHLVFILQCFVCLFSRGIISTSTVFIVVLVVYFEQQKKLTLFLVVACFAQLQVFYTNNTRSACTLIIVIIFWMLSDSLIASFLAPHYWLMLIMKLSHL